MAIEAVCLGWAGRGRQGRASPTVSSWIYGIGAFICLKWPSHLGYFKVLQNSSTYFNHQGISSYICSSSRYFKVFQGISRYVHMIREDFCWDISQCPNAAYLRRRETERFKVVRSLPKLETMASTSRKEQKKWWFGGQPFVIWYWIIYG